VDEALDVAEATASLNRPVGEEESSELGDLFDDPDASDPAEEAVETVRREEIRRAVAALPADERRVLELRFGFDGEPASLEAIGRELGVSREHVNRLQADAFAKLERDLELADAA
jgi:RNA polymerase primary sigma factor